MKIVTLILRILLAAPLIIFGLNKFLQFLPPVESAGAAATYMGGIMASGYTFPVIAIIEILVGLSLLANKYVPLALVFLAPISVNIVLYHLLLDLPNIPMGGLVFALNLMLLFFHRRDYASLLKA